MTTQRSTPIPEGTSTEPAAGQATQGRTLVITGDLRANEDVTIGGHIEGTIE